MALSHNELWFHSAAKKYDKTETFWSSTVRAAAAAAGQAVEATAEAIGDHCCEHRTHTVGNHCIHIISSNKF